MLKSKIIALILIVFGVLFNIQAQDPARFAQQIDEILAGQKDAPASPIIFTGSSSVRMWKSLAADFPGHPVLNRGFGGSQMSDLLYYLDRLVIADQPKQVFIYEGDNDISSRKTTKEILKDFKEGYKRLRKALPDADIVLISPKPSIARWELRAQYEELNAALAKWAGKKKNLRFADVWTPMLNDRGEPMTDIFIQDNLHMNAKGYAIWREVIAGFIR
jgi:lysophospholipase L1-like esterase